MNGEVQYNTKYLFAPHASLANFDVFEIAQEILSQACMRISFWKMHQ